ncbi:MAG: hypothetical protein ACKOWF_14825 [Chloroflexota bacterium]
MSGATASSTMPPCSPRIDSFENPGHVFGGESVAKDPEHRDRRPGHAPAAPLAIPILLPDVRFTDVNKTSAVTVVGAAVQVTSNAALATAPLVAGAIYVEDNGTLNQTTFTGISDSNVTYGAANTPTPICIKVASGTPTTVANCAY